MTGSPIVSYAQNFEDVMLWRALGHVQNGFYIDVGAQDPIVDSVSLAFYEQGWRGLHVEPTHHYATLLRQHRADETVLETAVGAEAGIIKFYEIPDSGISTADEHIAQQHLERGFKVVEINVPCVTLASVFKSCGRKEVHWLKIDVEGFEEQVLAGWKLSKVRPWIVVVESTLPLTQIESYETWEPLLLGYGYSYVYFDGLNRFYVSNAKKELERAFRAPPNVFDGFSVGGTASTNVHRVLVERHSKQIDDLNAIVVEHAARERAALASAAATESAVKAEWAASSREQEVREARQKKESDARVSEMTRILEAAQAASARLMDSLRQQSALDRSDAARASEAVNALQHATSLREAALQTHIAALRDEHQALSAKLFASDREHSERLTLASTKAQQDIAEQALAYQAREQVLVAQAQCDTSAAHAELKTHLLQMVNQERVHNENVLRLHEELKQQRKAQEEAFFEHENVLKREFSSQISAQHVALEESKSAYAREQVLMAQARRDIDAARAESGVHILNVAGLERAHSENMLRLQADLLQQLTAQSVDFTARENSLRGEFATQLALQHHALEASRSSATQRERELSSELGTEKQVSALLDVQLNDIRRDAAAALAREHALRQELDANLQQIEAHRAEISLIRNTLSWRMSAPLRHVAGWFRESRPPPETRMNPATLKPLFSNSATAHAADSTPPAHPIDLKLARNTTGPHGLPTLMYGSMLDAMNDINHVNQLLALHDIAFVRAAYQHLLRRDADDAGERFYIARLREGIAKADIIFEISQSDEGKRAGAKLAGLREFVVAHPPVRGWGFRSTVVRLTRIEKQVNRLENQLGRANAAYSKTADVIEEKLQNLESLLQTLNDANEQRMNQMELALTASVHDSNRQVVEALDNRLVSFSGDVGRRFNQIEATVTNLHESVAQQIEMLVATQKKSVESTERVAEKLPPEPVTNESRNEPTNANISLLHAVDQFEPTPPVVFPEPKGLRKLYYYIDHTVGCPVNTGMQRVARRLGRALLEAGEQIYFIKWDAFQRSFSLVNRDELAHFGLWNGPVLNPKHSMQYPLKGESAKAIEKHVLEAGHWLIVPEVTHITPQAHAMTLDVVMEAKRLGLRSAFIFYDATPLRRAELAGMAKSHETYMQQLLLADLVLPISNWSCSDLVSFFQVHEKATLTPTPRIVALPLPGESQLAQRVTAPINDSELHKLILCVGSITPHKNQVALVHAFEQFCDLHPDTEWQLSIVGNLHPDLAEEVSRAVRENSNIKYLEHIPDDQLDALYRQCAFTVFPSLEEGFGLPILESLWYGKPCVCANFGAMAEVAADGGCFAVDVRNGEALLRAITTLVEQPDKLRQLSIEAVRRNIADWSEYGQRFTDQLNALSEPVNRLGVIYYWVDHTVTFYKNTGIQRVVRGLARALMEQGHALVPVKWDQATSKFYPPSSEELEYLAKWNGPKVSAWAEWTEPKIRSANDWLLIPELVLYLDDQRLADLKKHIFEVALRCAWVFYDAIPWKMREIFPIEFTKAHGRYMEWLSKFELVFPISDFSRGDLLSFLGSTHGKTNGSETRIQTCVLPGEFHETDRTRIPKKIHPSIVKILCVGTVEPRKNHLLMLDAFVEAVAQTTKRVELYIVGRSTVPELAAEVERFIERVPNIIWEQDADDTRLHELFLQCDFTVYPSLEEGFGLPILESLWNARPCICRDSGAMAEVAKGGGCLMVDTANFPALASAILKLVEDEEFRVRLATEAINLSFKTWRDYAAEVATRLVNERHTPPVSNLPTTSSEDTFYGHHINLQKRPILSICISTYNREKWLALNLRNLFNLISRPNEEIEIVVCDNASTDNTSDVVQPYLARQDFRYYRNAINVGMLGNLRVTAHHARGQYIWILGDDDLVKPGGIENILEVIRLNPNLALVYLNYGYTREEDASAITDLDKFFKNAPPICPPSNDILGTVSQISTESENFFTAIYCLVLRRDHAIRAYSQNIEGRPFSTLLTCIPTTYHALNFMMQEPAYWLGQPQLVVNLNVSWMKYAPLWILERIPEAYDLAEKMGASPAAVDQWRSHNLASVLHFFKDIYESDPESNGEYFLPSRLLGRIKHLENFPEQVEAMRTIYEQAHLAGHPKAKIPTGQMFPSF